MLTEEALVVSSEGTQAVVRTRKSEACQACGARGTCDMLGGGKEVEVQVLNYIRARAGDRVELALPEAVFLKASVIVYVLPLAALLAGRPEWPVVGLVGLGVIISTVFVKQHYAVDCLAGIAVAVFSFGFMYGLFYLV